MTIPEASQLVIQAGAMALGGDVFVLDMGDPVKIVDLAHRMIELSGFEVKGDDHPDGDIEIIFTGLRPGEKLFEELLIGDSVTGTKHPKILRANEVFVEEEVVLEALRQLEKAEDSLDAEAARTILQSVVRGFKPNSALVDLLDKRPV
jgi:FlaA1/EpsC-like NDP-sugar epimerase